MSELTGERPTTDVHELETGMKEQTVQDVVWPYISALAAAEDWVQSESWDDLDTFKGEKAPPKSRWLMSLRRQPKQPPYASAKWENVENDDITYESNLLFPTEEDPVRRYQLRLHRESIKGVPTIRLDHNRDTKYTFGMLTWTKDSSPIVRDLFSGQKDMLALLALIEESEHKDRVNKYEIYFDLNKKEEDPVAAKFSIRRLSVGPAGEGEFDRNTYAIEGKTAKAMEPPRDAPAAIELGKIVSSIKSILSLVPTRSEPMPGITPLRVMLNPSESVATKL